MADLKNVKKLLLDSGKNKTKVEKAMAYLSTNQQVGRHSDIELYTLVAKYLNAGTNLDGTNVVLTGQNMGLITFHGYMNKVKSLHPEVFFDVQLVRGKDEFKFAKESGSIVYTHNIDNPFGDDEIKGAYCVVKLNNGSGDESLELLNSRDFNEMKKKSRQSKIWDEWPTEFWRKSVIKRACKVYFAEEIRELEEIDNADYGLTELENEKADDKTKNDIISNAKKAKK